MILSLPDKGPWFLPAPYRCLLGIFILITTLVPPLAAQRIDGGSFDLALSADDIRIYPSPEGGYDIFIRKKPAIESLQFAAPGTGTTPVFLLTGDKDAATNDALLVSTGKYKGQAWYLLNSTAETDPVFGASFYIYLPATVLAHTNPPSGPLIIQTITEGYRLVIRAYARPYAEAGAAFQDSFYIIRLTEASNPQPDPPVSLPASQSPPSSSAALTLLPGIAVFRSGPQGVLNESLNLLSHTEVTALISFTHTISPMLGYEIDIDRDSLLMNRIILRAALRFDALSLAVGPALGLLNPDGVILNPGLSVILKASLPSEPFLSLHIRLDTSLKRALSNGEYCQDLQEFNLSAAVSPFSFGFTLTHRELTRRTRESADTNSNWIRYNLSAFYSPWRYRFSAGLNLGYQELSWEYRAGIRSAAYHYPLIYTGLEASLWILPYLELLAAGELPLYPWDYWRDDQSPLWITARLGFRLTF